MSRTLWTDLARSSPVGVSIRRGRAASIYLIRRVGSQFRFPWDDGQRVEYCSRAALGLIRPGFETRLERDAEANSIQLDPAAPPGGLYYHRRNRLWSGESTRMPYTCKPIVIRCRLP
jgi:hypothetical protein